MSVTVEKINQRARDHAYDIDAIDWGAGVDDAKLHFPEDHVPLAFTAGWSLLGDEEKRTANQWYACAVAEQFIFLENSFLVPAVQSLLTAQQKTLSPALREALEVFVVEEVKHGAMFRRLLQASSIERYEKSDFHFYTPGALGVRFAALCLQAPTLFIAWPWLGMILEEKTIAYHRAYERAAGQGHELDGLHRAVHRFHFLDEARHVQLESILIEHLWDRAPQWLKGINRPLLFHALGQYTRPRDKSVSANIVRALVKQYPRLQPHLQTLLDGVRALRGDAQFQRSIYGTAALPQTFRLIDAHEELHGISCVAPDYAPPTPVTA